MLPLMLKELEFFQNRYTFYKRRLPSLKFEGPNFFDSVRSFMSTVASSRLIFVKSNPGMFHYQKLNQARIYRRITVFVQPLKRFGLHLVHDYHYDRFITDNCDPVILKSSRPNNILFS